MVKVVAKNFIKMADKTNFLELVKELVEKTRKEEGCISYELFQDLKSDNVFTFIEEWTSEEALKKHMNSEHFKEIVPKFGKYAEKEGQINIYKKLV